MLPAPETTDGAGSAVSHSRPGLIDPSEDQGQRTVSAKRPPRTEPLTVLQRVPMGFWPGAALLGTGMGDQRGAGGGRPE